MSTAPTVFSTEAQLRELLGHPMDLAARKAIPFLDKYCKAFIERVRAEVRSRAFPLLAEKTIIRYASLGGDAGSIGTAGLARRNVSR